MTDRGRPPLPSPPESAVALYARWQAAKDRLAELERTLPPVGETAAGGIVVPIYDPRAIEAARAETEAAQALPNVGDAIKRTPPLVPVTAMWRPLDSPTPRGDADQLMFTLNAAWLLMQQHTLLDRIRERPERSQRQAYARAGKPIPEVSVIDLRRAYVPQDRDPDAGGDGRTFRHRWVVSGHWRNQAFGRERSQRRRQWIPSYVKGQDGAPLLVTEKVNVWRR